MWRYVEFQSPILVHWYKSPAQAALGRFLLQFRWARKLRARSYLDTKKANREARKRYIAQMRKLRQRQ